MLHLRARLPGKGHPHRGGPGVGRGRALHQLRQLHHGLLPGRQGLRQRSRRCPSPARAGERGPGGRPRRRVARAVLPGRLLGAAGPGDRSAARGRFHLRGRGRLRRRPGQRGLPGISREAPHRPSHRQRLPGRGGVRAQIPPLSHRPDHAHRLPHGRHRAGGQRALRPAGALRLHRALRGKKVRDARSAGGECHRRGADAAGTGESPRCTWGRSGQDLPGRVRPSACRYRSHLPHPRRSLR